MKMRTILLVAACCGSAVHAGEIAKGTETRAWLGPDATPISSLPPLAPTRPIELTGVASALRLDPRTRIWGVPVPRLGDPDFAPDSPYYTGTVPDATLTLPARVFTPDGKLDRARPCILVTNGYGVADKSPENGIGHGSIWDDIIPHGYTGILVALRQSSGDPQDHQVGLNGYYTHYGEDGVAIINDIVRRFGCGMEGDDPKTAKVGMVGASLVGGSQWAVVNRPDFPAALRAIAPDAAGMTNKSYSTLWFPGGMLPGPLRITRPGHELGDVFPAHRNFDAYWQERQLSSGQLQSAASRRLALLMTGGWDEYNTPGNLDGYVQYRALSGVTNKRLVISPTGHTTPNWLYRPLVIAWMDQYLKGMQPKIPAPAVLLYIRGAERWRAETAWPLPDTHYVDVALGAEHSGTIDSRNDGMMAARATSGAPATYAYDPDSGPFLHVMVSQSVQAPNTRRLTSDQRPEERKLVTWTSRPLDAATEITGNAVLDFWASSTTDDADFVASLTDVAPDGSSRQIVQGYLNGPREAYTRDDAVPAPPVPLVPGTARGFTLRLLPTATVVAAGHRLRLTLGGGADIGVGNDGAPQHQPQGPGKNPHSFTVSILQDSAHPALIKLPIIGSVPLVLLQ